MWPSTNKHFPLTILLGPCISMEAATPRLMQLTLCSAGITESWLNSGSVCLILENSSAGCCFSRAPKESRLRADLLMPVLSRWLPVQHSPPPTKRSEIINNMMGLIPVGLAAYFMGEVGSMIALSERAASDGHGVHSNAPVFDSFCAAWLPQPEY